MAGAVIEKTVLIIDPRQKQLRNARNLMKVRQTNENLKWRMLRPYQRTSRVMSPSRCRFLRMPNKKHWFRRLQVYYRWIQPVMPLPKTRMQLLRLSAMEARLSKLQVLFSLNMRQTRRLYKLVAMQRWLVLINKYSNKNILKIAKKVSISLLPKI